MARALVALALIVVVLGSVWQQSEAASFTKFLRSRFGGALTHYYPLNSSTKARDVIGKLHGVVHGSVKFGAKGAAFTGKAGNYIDLGNNKAFSVAGQKSKGMTIIHAMAVSDWSSKSNQNSEGYVHYMGKGHPSQHEWTCRYYPSTDKERPKRTSVYHYNLDGHLGTGSYVQDKPANGAWQVLAAGFDVVTASDSAANFPGANGFGNSFPGGTFLWKSGKPRDSDGFKAGGGGENIRPTRGSAPVTIGCRNDRDSWMKGKIRRVMFFNRKLTTAEVKLIHANWHLAD